MEAPRTVLARVLEAEGLTDMAVAFSGPSMLAPSLVTRARRGSDPRSTTAAAIVAGINAAVRKKIAADPGYTMGEIFGTEPILSLPKRPALPQEAAA